MRSWRNCAPSSPKASCPRNYYIKVCYLWESVIIRERRVLCYSRKRKKREISSKFFFSFVEKKMHVFFLCRSIKFSSFQNLSQKFTWNERTRRALFCRIVVVLLKVFLSLSPFCLSSSSSLLRIWGTVSRVESEQKKIWTRWRRLRPQSRRVRDVVAWEKQRRSFRRMLSFEEARGGCLRRRYRRRHQQ